MALPADSLPEPSAFPRDPLLTTPGLPAPELTADFPTEVMADLLTGARTLLELSPEEDKLFAGAKLFEGLRAPGRERAFLAAEAWTPD